MGTNYWLLDLLASSLGHRDEDVAKRLYRRLIERASEEDIGLIFSSVDRRNVPMMGPTSAFSELLGETRPNAIDYRLYVLDVDVGLQVHP